MPPESDTGKDSVAGFAIRARDLSNNGDTVAALALLGDGLEKWPANPRLSVLQMRVLRGSLRSREALEFALDLPRHVQKGAALVPLVALLIESGRAGEAQALVETACAGQPAPPPRCVLARARLAMDALGAAAALDVIERCGLDPASSPALAAERARLLAETGQTREAAAQAGLLEEIATDPSAILARLNTLLDLGLTGKAARAIEASQELGEVHPGWFLAAARLELARHDIDACLGVLRAGIARFPGHVRLNALLWKRMAQNGDGAGARAACEAFMERHRDSAAAQLEAALFLPRALEFGVSDEALERAGSLLGEAPEIARARIGALLTRKDALSAREALDEAEARLGGTGWPLLRARVEAAAGDDVEAISLLENLLERMPGNHDARLRLVGLLIDRGAFDAARRHLALLPADNGAYSARIGALVAEAAVLEGKPGEALREAEAALENDPDDPRLWRVISRCQLLLGDIAQAWDSHCRGEAYALGRDVSGTKSNKTRNSVPGQLLNEFRLHMQADLSDLCGEGTDQRAAMRHFRARAVANPGSSADAIYLFSAMLRAGLLPETPPEVKDSGEGIPRQVFQFWDSPEPARHIAALMEENARINPGYAFRTFNAREADAYLREKGEFQALRGFYLAQNPAAQADIFRLAVLYHEGGVYMDADDRCLHGLENLVDHRQRFIGVQEMFMSVANNFLAVRARDPILRAALDEAAIAFNGPSGESLWLASGPGAITRALAVHGTNADGSLSDGVWILPTHGIRKAISPHISVSYKTSSDYWVSSFRRAESKSG